MLLDKPPARPFGLVSGHILLAMFFPYNPPGIVMPTHAEKRVVPYSADQMYALIADVARYPEFLPWCAAARIRETRPGPDGTTVMDADLVISFKVYRERFGSRVTLAPADRTIDVE